MKRYASLAALDKVDIALYPGEIHAVLGENGAGKSTLVSILSGNLSPDEGYLSVGERRLHFRSPRDARLHGVDLVQQHFTLVPAFTVAENLALFSLTPGKTLNVMSAAQKALTVAETLGWAINPDALASSLSVGDMQRVEIIKALASEGNVLLLDEPTATLAPHEVEDLFRVLRKLKADGKSVVFITHKLDEALAIADRVTVLRLGRVVMSTKAAGISPSQLATWMVGDVPPGLSKPNQDIGSEVARVENLTIYGERGEVLVDDVSLTVSGGEIVGIGGVAGNGQVELAEALAGIRHGAKLPLAAYIPEDRHRDGLALSMSLEDNLLIQGHRSRSLTFFGFLLPNRVREWCEKIIAKFGIKADSIYQPAYSLSGGNQQKVVVGRVLDHEPKFIVAVNPTRGLDLHAENYVHSQLLAAKERGAAIVLFSTDLDELATLADRTYFMSGGKLREGDNAAELIGGRE